MIRISKTPLRVSFFGGGTDYPDYFERAPGIVVGTSINLYIYVNALPMPEFCEQRYRILYSNSESVNDINDIQHPVVKAVLNEFGYEDPLNLSIMSDVPGGTGLGSSSTFTVGFVNLVCHLSNRRINKFALAQKAIHIEHEVLKENVGIQDQIHAAYGGLSCYRFGKEDFQINPIRINADCQRALDSSMFLIYTRISRRATKTLDEQIERTKSRKIDDELSNLISLAEQSITVLEQGSPEQMLRDLGAMLDEGWQTKRSLSSNVSNSDIDAIYEKAKSLGAFGGKLCGAGAGGFFFVLAPSYKYASFASAFGEGNVMRVSTENSGSRVVTLSDY